MLVEIDVRKYKNLFPTDPHPFISEKFIELNKNKVSEIVRLVPEGEKASLGLIAGIADGTLRSPFSAPFGGFHFRNELVYVNEIDSYVTSLKSYITAKGLNGLDIILPPDLYHQTFNAKITNALIRNGFDQEIPEVTSWIDLNRFNGTFTQKNSREYYRQAVRNGLIFESVTDLNGKYDIYNLIRENRARFGRPIYMSFDDIIQTGLLWPVDFFNVHSQEGQIYAGAILYRNHPKICYTVYWGDNEAGRPKRAMDFLSYNLFSFYKKNDFIYIDMGISTENGIPNEGLLRFKETHEAESSLRFRFKLESL